ncbi:Planctomycete cytochrome C [Stieleria bergensis]|uniref:Planctomycete cytochrome C n=1 Tax=Stieleria bergensis TaxID=2528025 RepID=A0A517SW77_9BACT|nr:Planctomycete cytochrome C [Planctomycetes bacterium SV_7m_r]
MFRPFPAVLFAVFVSGAVLRADTPEPSVRMPAEHRALLKSHCAKCHNADEHHGNVRLDDLPFTINDIETAERWQKILNALNAGEMPPEGEGQIPDIAKTDFLDDLANTMVAARKLLADQKGAITMRRLNRREYQNTIRELLGVEIPVGELPSDTGSSNYDTVGANLFMSANQFEQYLSLGRKALDAAFARELAATEDRSWRYETEAISEKVAKFVESQIDAKARAEEWVKQVEEAAARPDNAEIVANLRAQVNNKEGNFRRLWKQIPGASSPESFGFQTKENNADKANRALAAYWLPYHRYYLEQPAIDTGMYLSLQTEHPSKLEHGAITFLLPWSYPSGVKWPAGNYIIRVRGALTGQGTPDRRFIEFGVNPRGSQALSVHEVTGTMESPEIIEIPFYFGDADAERADRTLYLREKGTHDHFLVTRLLAKEGAKQMEIGQGRPYALWIDWVEIERIPDKDRVQPPGLAMLGDLSLDDKTKEPVVPELEAVRGAFERFAQEAFRGREPGTKFIDGLVRRYETRLNAGDHPVVAFKESLAIVLSSPMFLYLAEPNLETKPRPLNDIELATRLSYFLWGSQPDHELRELAAKGELARPDVLREQTTRLLDDPRSRGFSDAFAYQWLGLDRLDFFQVDLVKHRRFDNATKLAARHEIYETVAYLLRENQSVSNLLKSDFAVINSVLAEYYNIEGVTGDEFRPVKLPQGSPRGGLLGMAAVSLMGGNGEETSPVERGAWVLRKLLNDPPPPAPANIPQIARLAGKVLTTQERLQAHQEEAQCASCHRRIDPIGMGLENFDAVGSWRTENTYIVKDDEGKPVKGKEKTWTIDPSGKLHNGPAFKDYFELRDILASKEENFARGLTEGLIEYALGRPVSFSDETLITSVVSQSKNENYAFREFVHAIVSSQEFQTK